MEEIWKDIKGYEGLYQVSNLGNIKRLSKPKRNYNINKRTFDIIMTPDKVVKPQLNQYGYHRIGLTKDFKRTHYSVHRLVAEAFIPNPENKPTVNHKDENKLNNAVSNLEWATIKENSNYGTRNERMGKSQWKAVKCLETGIVYNSLTEASKATGVTTGNLSSVCHHRPWWRTAGGYHWEFVEKENILGVKPEKKTKKKKVDKI